MGEMVVQTPETKKVLDEYDFTFQSGMTMPITIDTAAGDTIELTDSVIKIYLAARPSINDPALILPCEDVKLFTTHLVSINHRTRERLALTPEQEFEWKRTLKELGRVQ